MHTCDCISMSGRSFIVHNRTFRDRRIHVRTFGYDNNVLLRWNGVKQRRLLQGGVLSPLLFNCYADRIISLLKYAGLGCHLDICYVGCIMYADDLLLMS